MNHPNGPCMLCGETVGRAATDRVQMFGCNVWLSVCAPCARKERAEVSALLQLADTDDESYEAETGGDE